MILLGFFTPTTQAQTPAVITLAATGITGTNATLNGSVNPSNSTTKVYFAYTSDTNSYNATIPNPSFESNSFTNFPGYVADNGTISGWIASNPYAIGLNPADTSPFANNGATPDGTNVAFIQGNYDETNTFSTTITNLIVGKTYQVSFRSNRRDGYTTPNTAWSLNGGSFVPFTVDPAVGGTNQYYTNSALFTATAATASLALQNHTVDDSTVLVDAFSIASIPYGTFSSTNILPATNSNLSVSNTVNGLQPGTTYYFRIVASNSNGTVTGTSLTFTTGAGLPAATTLAATGIGATNATLNAFVNPGATATAVYFQYGPDTNYGYFTATNNLAATNITLSVSNFVGGLTLGTLYHFRVVASNSVGITFGADQTYTTVSVPTITTLPATAINATNATLNGNVNPGNGATAVYFSYGTDTNYASGTIPNPSFETNTFTVSHGSVTDNGPISGWTASNPNRIGLNPASDSPFADNGAKPSGVNVAFIQSVSNETNTLSTTITGLTIGGTYQVSFRANCRSSYPVPDGTWSLNGGNFVPFTASPAVGGTNPYYTNSGVFTATAATASLVLRNATSGDSTVLLDAFSISPFSPRSLSPTNFLSAANINIGVSNLISGLQPFTTYYFRIIASNSAGTATGAELTFTTGVAAPIVMTSSAVDVTTNHGTLTGSVYPNGSETVAWFRYGTGTNYDHFSSTNILPSTNVALSVSNFVDALSPGTLYHFQLVASNSSGVTVGMDQSFTSVRLATAVTVTNVADNGPGTLRQAIVDSVPGDSILFDASLSGASILLTSGQIVLTNNVNINASALTNGIRINGNGSSRLFQVETNTTVTLTALTLTNGNAVSAGGGIYNSGILTLDRCTFAGNSTIGITGSTGANAAPGSGSIGGTGGNGGNGSGGAIYNADSLTINQCTFTGNIARGGSGGTGGAGGSSFGNGGRGGTGGSGGTGAGAGIYNSGTLTVNQCTLAANTSNAGSGGAGGAGGQGGLGSNGSTGFTGSAGTSTAGGIYNSGTMTLFNAIVALNSPDNLVGPVIQTGLNLTNGNPLLSTLGNNGGPTPTMILLANSPAFEAGTSTPFTNDQRGFARPMGSAPDLGAVEMTAPSVSTLPASNVTNITASINGLVNPNGLAVSAYFQYGTTTNYGSFSGTNSLAITNTTISVANIISNLQPATTYYFRIIVVGNIGLTVGSNMSFTTTIGVPVVTTTAASAITASTATLNGTLNPSGLPTATYFEYGQTTSYGSFSATNAASTNVALPVSTLVSNLVPGTVYHYRIVALNSGGTSTGSNLTFTTLPQTPVATTLAATGVTATGATLNGLVNPGNGATTVYFRYSRTTNFALTSATIPNPSFEANSFSISPGYISANGSISGWIASTLFRTGLNPASGNPFADNGAKPDGANVAFIQSNSNETNTLSTTISNLTVEKTYVVSFRANCRGSGYPVPNSSWSLNGSNFVTFTSSPAVGSTNAYYTNAGSFTATSNTAPLILRNNTPTDSTLLIDAFAIVEDPVNGGFSATNIVAPSMSDTPVSVTVTGLQPATTYNFQVVAFNSGGTSTGTMLTFTTAGAKPAATTLPATDISSTSATVNGTVNSQGNPTTYYFEYGTSTNYGSFSGINPLAATNVAVSVSNSLTGLLPATLYHFRVVATNSQGTSFGADQAFATTSAAPAIISLSSTVLTTNSANGLVSVQLSATIRPNGSATAGYFEYGRTTAYAATNSFAGILSNTVTTNITTTANFSVGLSYHWRVVATNSLGADISSDQTFSLGSLVTSSLPGDINGDGIVSQSELEAVYNGYVTTSPWLYITNTAGLGGTNVSFALSNSLSGAYTVQYSTNLLDWITLGPASPRYLFTDTNAPALPQRFYRLIYP